MNKRKIDKIIRKIYETISKPAVKNFVFFFIIGVLAILVVLFSIYPIDIWKKIVAELYLASLTGYFVIAAISDFDNKRIGFRSISTGSFLLWCLFIPILTGCIIAVLLKRYIDNIEMTDITFWMVSLFESAFLIMWSWDKLNNKEDLTCYLDKYSTAIIAFFSIITILFDLENKKFPIIILFANYFVVQLMIKEKICKNHSNTESVE